MQLRISIDSGVPIYQQVVEQVKHLVAGGRLKPGADVPPIRVLAEQLRINPNTVARAYLELQREGVIVTRQGSGTVVAESKPSMPRKEKMKILARTADVLLTDASHLGVPLDDVLALILERDEALHPEESK